MKGGIIMYAIPGIISFILCILSAVLLVLKKRSAPAAAYAALFFFALTCLAECRMAAGWVRAGDWNALEDTLVSDAAGMTKLMAAVIAVNAAALIAEVPRRRRSI